MTGVSGIQITIVISEEITAWIRRVASLNDADMEEEFKLIKKNSVNAFARAIGRIRSPELDSHTFRNGTCEAHLHADTINLLLSVSESLHSLPSIRKFLSVLFRMPWILIWTSMQES